MSKKEIHELFDMVLAIGSSSKHHVNFELDTQEYAGNELDLTVYIFERENGVSKGIIDRYDITAFDVHAKVWLEAWAKIVNKEREEDVINRY